MSRRIMVLLWMSLGLCNFVWGQNHSLGSNQVVVNTQSHWSHWTFVPGTLDIAPSGEVRPAFVPKDHNAVTDIFEHLLRSARKTRERDHPRCDRSGFQRGGYPQSLRWGRDNLLGTRPQIARCRIGGSRSIWAA